MTYKVPQLEPFLGEEELNNLKRAIETNWLTEGPFAKEFLEKILQITKSKYGVLASTGTLGLYLALLAVDIKHGDDVIVPDFTFSASAASVVAVGANPVFVDVIEDDLNIDVSLIEKNITPRTKAIMPVHIYGRSCDMSKIVEIAQKYNLRIVEDAAQAFGIFHKGKHAGTFGDTSMISFFADKTITTGEGSVVLTNDEKIYNKLRYLRNQGRVNSGTFVHPEHGMNFRMTDLQCAVGVAQINKFRDIEKRKLEHYDMYSKLLKDFKEIRFIKGNDHSNFIPFRANIMVEHLKELMPYLEGKGIQTRGFFYPLHKQPYLSHLKYRESDFPVSNKAYEEGLSLPVFYNLKKEQIEYICDTLKEFYFNLR